MTRPPDVKFPWVAAAMFVAGLVLLFVVLGGSP